MLYELACAASRPEKYHSLTDLFYTNPRKTGISSEKECILCSSFIMLFEHLFMRKKIFIHKGLRVYRTDTDTCLTLDTDAIDHRSVRRVNTSHRAGRRATAASDAASHICHRLCLQEPCRLPVGTKRRIIRSYRVMSGDFKGCCSYGRLLLFLQFLYFLRSFPGKCPQLF